MPELDVDLEMDPLEHYPWFQDGSGFTLDSDTDLYTAAGGTPPQGEPGAVRQEHGGAVPDVPGRHSAAKTRGLCRPALFAPEEFQFTAPADRLDLDKIVRRGACE